ncbi:hypothetical protein LT493_23550 [Streptomyces tricolor]|nr:hypothetical protein [Streptomyces tricolor]
MSSGIPVRCSDSELYAHMLDILGRLGGLRHHQPQVEPRTDPLRPGAAGRQRHRQRAALERGEDQGQPGGDRGSRRRRRARCRLVGAHRRGPGRRPVVVGGPLHAAAHAGRGDRPRHRRHEGLHRPCLAILSRTDHARLTTPVTLMLTYEEEIGCVGARHLVEEMRTWRDG